MTVSPYYVRRLSLWVLRDEAEDVRIARLTTHIGQGDCFPYLASIVGMLAEAPEGSRDLYREEVRKDLIYLHEHYDLQLKPAALSYSKRSVIRFDQ
jgi:hypothetical protein